LQESLLNAYQSLSETEPELLDDIFDTACDQDLSRLRDKIYGEDYSSSGEDGEDGISSGNEEDA
jgi:hypothetical protein